MMDNAELDNVFTDHILDDVLWLNEAEEAYNVWGNKMYWFVWYLCTHIKEKSSSYKITMDEYFFYRFNA